MVELDTMKPVFGSQHRLRLHISFIMALYYKIQQIILQMRQLFHYKMWQRFITKRIRFLITKCDNFI